MIHILFLILKIIGIILLAILGILVLSLCLVLLMPARYQVRAKTEDGIEQLSASVRAFWFLHLISAAVDYRDKKFNWQFRIAWKKFNVPEKKEDEKTSDRSEKKENEKTEEASKASKPDEASKDSKSDEASKAHKKAEHRETKHKANWLKKIKCTIRKICDKIKMLWEMKEKVTDFLTDEVHQNAFRRLKAEVITLAKRLSPRTLKGFVRFGFEDPYNTGRVLALLSVLYPFYGEKIEIFPEFDKKLLEGDVYMKGSIRGIHLLLIIVRLLFDGNIRKTFQDIKSFK